jgi:hypothetical protein
MTPMTLEVVYRLIDNLRARIREIDTDERYHYPSATVVENAPLAFIQLNMEVTAYECQRTLRLLGYNGPEMQVRKGPAKTSPKEK